MKSDQASRTAEVTTIFRAIESLRPTQARLFYDKYAPSFLRSPFRLILKNRTLAKFVLWLMINRRFPGATDTIVSRIRFIDDTLKDSITEGIEQLVILGAGYDARACRFNELKKKKILNIFGSLPDHVVYVPVDFEKDRLISKLTNPGDHICNSIVNRIDTMLTKLIEKILISDFFSYEKNRGALDDTNL